MTNNLFKLINSIVPLKTEEQELIVQAVQLKTIAKGAFFVKEGLVCHNLGF